MNNFAPPLRSGRPVSGGFTLIELLVTVIVVGVLAAVALPAFMDTVRKSRRSDAFSSLAIIQQAQERFRGGNTSYGNLAETPDSLTLPNVARVSAKGYYTLSVSGNNSTGYVALATARDGQVADTRCKLIGVRLLGGNLSYGSGQDSIDWTDPGKCWAN